MKDQRRNPAKKRKPKTLMDLFSPDIQGAEHKMEKARARIKRLERKAKGLATRIKTAKRSLAALERADRARKSKALKAEASR